MNLLFLPNQLKDVREVLHSLDWQALGSEVEQELQSRLVIVGPVNSGKSTLFNRLHGHRLSAVSAVPGTTKGVVEHPLGPFLLVDTPGYGEVWGVDRADTANRAASTADLIILLLDAVAGVRQSDHDLYDQLQQQAAPVLVVLNKADLVKRDLPWILENTKKLMGVHPIVISAETGMGVVDALIPAILDTQPPVALAMARSLPGVRKQIVNRVIRRAAWTNAMIALQPVPGLDIPVLLTSQTRMVLRIGAAYGESMSTSHAREFLTTMAGSLATRYLAGQLAKFIPGPGWLVSAALAAFTTWSIGQAAHQYFMAGATLNPPDLRALYQRMRKLAPRQLLRRDKPPAAPETP